MADMIAVMALQKAERLVSTVARAFYTDTTVLVVDTLLREKYIKDSDEELGNRLNLKPQQVRAAMTELLSEGLAAKEKMSDQLYSGRSSDYWYIDLRHAVNVILLRVCYMKEMLAQRQEAKAARQVYVCPRCHEKFEVMDICKLSNGDSSFCCSHCCPNDDHSDCKRGSGYTLVEFHDKRGLDTVTLLSDLLNEQLGKSTDPTVPRESIFELMHALRDTAVPTNFPSQLRERGMGGQQRSDTSSAHARFEDDFHYRGRAAEKAAAERHGGKGGGGSGSGGGGRSTSSNKAVQLLYTKNWRGEEIVVEIEQSEDEEMDDDDWTEDGGAALFPSRASIRRKAAEDAAKEERAAKRAKKALPAFLSGSNISGDPDSGGGSGGGIAGDGDDVDEGGSSDESAPNGVAGGSGSGVSNGTNGLGRAAHVRRLGAAAVTSLEERDEMKKKLLPWTEHMKQVWRRQQQQQMELDEASEGGGDSWWNKEDGDSPANGVVGFGGGRRGLGGGIGSGPGVMFRVGGRYVTMDALTIDDAAKMSPDEYTRWYNLAVSQRG